MPSLLPHSQRRANLEAVLENLGARFEAIGAEAAWLAGHTFRTYPQVGGPREHVIPDFLIAAHAQVQADQLAASNRGYFRKYFPKLPLLPHRS